MVSIHSCLSARRFFPVFIVFLLALLVSATARAQTQIPEDPGPYGPAVLSVVSLNAALLAWNPAAPPQPTQLGNPDLDYVFVRPTSAPPGGLRPLVIFMHGYSGNPYMYWPLIEHIVSWGFAVGVPWYDEDLCVQNPIDEAADADAMRLALATNPAATPYHDPAAEVLVVGHSMGATASLLYAGQYADVRCAIAIQPYKPELLPQPAPTNPCANGLYASLAGGTVYADIGAYAGSVYVLRGNDDTLVGASPDFWYGLATSAQRRVLVAIDDVGHLAPTNLVSDGTLEDADEQRLVRRFVGGLLRAEFDPAEENLCLEVLGSGLLDEPVTAEGASTPHTIGATVTSDCNNPLFWVVRQPGSPTLWSPLPNPAPAYAQQSVALGFAGKHLDLDAMAVVDPAVGQIVWISDNIGLGVGASNNVAARTLAETSGVWEYRLPDYGNGIVLEIGGVRANPVDMSFGLTRVAPLVFSP